MFAFCLSNRDHAEKLVINETCSFQSPRVKDLLWHHNIIIVFFSQIGFKSSFPGRLLVTTEDSGRAVWQRL